MHEPAPKPRLPTMGSLGLRLMVAGGLLAAMLAALAVGVSPQAVLGFVQDSQGRWAGWAGGHLALAAVGYALFYMAAVTISLPGALWFTIGAGFLLGATAAIPVSLFGITFGAANAWLIMRYLSGPALRQRFSDRIARFAAGFRRNEFAYVVLLRVLPLPFFLVNLAAALLGHRFAPYAAGTLLGSLPSVVLYANLGSGMSELVAAGVQPGLSDLTRPSFLIAILMVVLMVGVAVVHRFWTRRRAIDGLPQCGPQDMAQTNHG